MSGGVWPHKRNNGCLELKIVIRYEGLKATQYFSKFTSQSDAVFREDLIALKLPHPKRENTTFVSYGCVECIWPIVPKNGMLHKQVLARTKPPSLDEQKALGILLGKLSISTLVAKEINSSTSKGRKDLKRPNPFASEGTEEGSSSGLPRSERNNYRVSLPITGKRSLPPDHVVPKVAEADAFLQVMSDSFRPHKIPKLEPVDVPIPPESLPTRPVRTLRLPRSSSSLSSHISSISKATNPPESTSSWSSLVSQNPPQAQVVPPSHANYVFPPPPKPLPLPATTPTVERKMIMPTSLRDEPAPIKEMLRELQPFLSTPQSLPEQVQRQASVSDAKPMSIPPIPVTQTSSEVVTTTISRPNASNIPMIQRLTRESCDIRRRINADSVRDADIISELKQLNAAYIPGRLKIGIEDLAMEGRIRKLEQDLDTERGLRLEAEDVVRDIRRECKTPFVVPGLLDAFIKLSRLTTQATRLNGTVTKESG